MRFITALPAAEIKHPLSEPAYELLPQASSPAGPRAAPDAAAINTGQSNQYWPPDSASLSNQYWQERMVKSRGIIIKREDASGASCLVIKGAPPLYYPWNCLVFQ